MVTGILVFIISGVLLLGAFVLGAIIGGKLMLNKLSDLFVKALGEVDISNDTIIRILEIMKEDIGKRL